MQAATLHPIISARPNVHQLKARAVGYLHHAGTARFQQVPTQAGPAHLTGCAGGWWG